MPTHTEPRHPNGEVAVSERRENAPAGMKMAFFHFAESYVELVSNLGDDGPIAKRLADRGEGVHIDLGPGGLKIEGK